MACVRKRRGRYVVDFRDERGVRRWESYRTRKEADDALSTRVRDMRRGSYRAPSEIPSFESVAREWLEHKQDRRPATLAQWEAHLEKHILPTLGPLRLDQISVAVVERLRDSLRKAGLAPQTVNKVLTTVAAVFKFANRREYIDRNPAVIAERLHTGSGQVTVASAREDDAQPVVSPEGVLSPDQAGKLVAASDPGLYQTVFLAALLTGARIGELTALMWSDVDFETASLSIRRNLSWARTKGDREAGRKGPQFFEPKTRASRRTLRMPPELVSALRRWKLACPPGELGLVFPKADGSPLHRKQVLAKGLLPALGRAKLPRVDIHSLRHTFASALIMDGAPVTEVASLLGHSSPQVTLTRYSHWFKQVRTASVENLARAVIGGV